MTPAPRPRIDAPALALLGAGVLVWFARDTSASGSLARVLGVGLPLLSLLGSALALLFAAPPSHGADYESS